MWSFRLYLQFTGEAVGKLISVSYQVGRRDLCLPVNLAYNHSARKSKEKCSQTFVRILFGGTCKSFRLREIFLSQ